MWTWRRRRRTREGHWTDQRHWLPDITLDVWFRVFGRRDRLSQEEEPHLTWRRTLSAPDHCSHRPWPHRTVFNNGHRVNRTRDLHRWINRARVQIKYRLWREFLIAPLTISFCLTNKAQPWAVTHSTDPGWERLLVGCQAHEAELWLGVQNASLAPWLPLQCSASHSLFSDLFPRFLFGKLKGTKSERPFREGEDKSKLSELTPTW